VNVNVRTGEEKKRRKRKKRVAKKKPTTIERPLQASAYNTTLAPNRPYIPMTSYIASPYNNGLVPDMWQIRDMAQQTWQNMKKATQQMLMWENKQIDTEEKKQTATAETIHSQSQRPLSTVNEGGEEIQTGPITIPLASSGRGINPSPLHTMEGGMTSKTCLGRLCVITKAIYTSKTTLNSTDASYLFNSQTEITALILETVCVYLRGNLWMILPKNWM
jgi:hypothetical protein